MYDFAKVSLWPMPHSQLRPAIGTNWTASYNAQYIHNYSIIYEFSDIMVTRSLRCKHKTSSVTASISSFPGWSIGKIFNRQVALIGQPQQACARIFWLAFFDLQLGIYIYVLTLYTLKTVRWKDSKCLLFFKSIFKFCTTKILLTWFRQSIRQNVCARPY